MKTPNLVQQIEEKLKTVYDPEFPMVDIFTLGLIYNIELPKDKKTKNIIITITFTTPFCPMADFLQQMIKNAAQEVAPQYTIDIIVTFDPPRTIDKVKDPDLKKMFE